MRLKWEELEPLVDAALAFKGRNVHVHSTITGFSTSLAFAFEAEYVGVAISNTRLMFLGPSASFNLSLRDVSSFSVQSTGEIGIKELFEGKVERVSRLKEMTAA